MSSDRNIRHEQPIGHPFLKVPVDATDTPLAAVDGVVRTVLVDPRAEAGRAELEGH